MDWLLAGLGIGGLGSLLGYAFLRKKGMHRWLPSYIATQSKRGDPDPNRPIHLLLCIADHYEPKLGNAPPEVAQRRVQRWVEDYPKFFGHFRDSDGRPPRHTFFYPVEEYEPEYLDAIAGLCRAGYGEVEIHLHHDNDTAENLRKTLLSFKEVLANRHGLLSRDRKTGEIVYGFIHGNWALDNSRSDGRLCGVNNELDILRETGCYADFTLPSFPSETQTRKINSIYWAVDDPNKPKSHDTGIDFGAARKPEKSILLIQGPLLFDWKRRKWSIIPRIENACIQGNQVPTMHRLDLWLRAAIRIPQKPDWYFVKLHTHGANEKNMDVLLGESMVKFHQGLRDRAERNKNFHYHYVTAREMANCIFSVENAIQGNEFQGTVPEGTVLESLNSLLVR
jgi:hypothetical protein